MSSYKYKPTRFMLPTSHYDKAAADRAVTFIQCLCHTKGQWAGQPFLLMPWQEQIVRDIFGTLKANGKRQFSTAFIEISKKNGKQLALDTPIPTPAGWSTMGELKIGDCVFDEEGNVCHVVAKSQVDDTEQAYKLTFRDGSSIIAGENHLWDVEDTYFAKPKHVIYKTKEIYERSKEAGAPTIRIPVVKQLKQSASLYEDVPQPECGFHYLKDIEPLSEKIKMQCIQVDSTSHCYLAGPSMVPTHNSELAAAIALYLLYADNEPSAEVYGAAADRQQASIVFDVANQMVQMCPALYKRSRIKAATKRIVNTANNGIYQVLSADVANKHGFNVSGLVFDELHAQPNRNLYDVLTKGSGDAREQPLFFLITTAGNDTHSICYELHQKAKDILEGRKVDHTFYPVIFGADDTDDWTDPKVWKKANPSLGITITEEKVRDACEQAKQNPAEENTFRQLRLNQWVKQQVRWMPMDKWDACLDDYSEDKLLGRVCYGGLDLSSTSDITAFVLVFPPGDDDPYYRVLPYFWLPEDTIRLRVTRDHVPYDIWNSQGYFFTTEGNVVHYGYIEEFIKHLGEKFNIKEIAYDRWGATQMSQNLEGDGFTVVPFGQGFSSMSAPTKDLMRMVLSKELRHNGHPVLRWMMDNVYVKQDPAGNIKMDKEKSTEKIDGAVALVMALDRAIRNGNGGSGSVYDQRDIFFL